MFFRLLRIYRQLASSGKLVLFMIPPMRCIHLRFARRWCEMFSSVMSLSHPLPCLRRVSITAMSTKTLIGARRRGARVPLGMIEGRFGREWNDSAELARFAWLGRARKSSGC